MNLEMDNWKIRPAERRDCNAIANLIKELAVFEQMEDQAKLTGPDLERDAFDSSPPYFRCIVAETTAEDSAMKEMSPDQCQNLASGEHIIVGFILYFYEYSTWEGKTMYMEDFYITPKYRHKGIGEKMFKFMAKMCTEGGFARLKFECLDWNESAIKFYKKHYAVDMTSQDGWHSFRVNKDNLRLLAQD